MSLCIFGIISDAMNVLFYYFIFRNYILRMLVCLNISSNLNQHLHMHEKFPRAMLLILALYKCIVL